MIKVSLLDGLIEFSVAKADAKYANPEDKEARGYFHRLLERPGQMERQARASKAVLERISLRNADVIEAFGGSGMFALLVQKFLKPKHHIICEHDPFCAAHLRKLSKDWKGSCVVECDSFVKVPTLVSHGSLVSLDWHGSTMLSLFQDVRHRTLLDGIRRYRPAYVQVTDKAISKLHLNLKPYSALAKRRVTDFESYVSAMGRLIEDRWGWSVQFVAYHTGAASLLLSEKPNKRIELLRV